MWKVLHASAFGVPQLRPRFVLVALQRARFTNWSWPATSYRTPPTVGHTLEDLMAARGWRGAQQWAQKAGGVAPTIVGASHKHGGPDLGPTRARQAWAELGVNGLGVADEAPGPDAPAGHRPKLTVRMVARLQGFPDEWEFAGSKTAAYRQIGNAFPPPVAAAVGESIHSALAAGRGAAPPCDRHGGSRRQPLRVDIGQGRLFLSTLMCARCCRLMTVRTQMNPTTHAGKPITCAGESGHRRSRASVPLFLPWPGV